MKRKLFIFAAVLTIALPALAQSSGIVVTAKAKDANPTLIFSENLSDQALSSKILSDLNHCGWFDVRKSGNVTYRVSAKGSLQDFTVTVSNNAGVQIHSCQFKGSKSVDTAAHTAVDAILNKLFGIQGICRSKIVFSAATSAKNREIYICDFDGANWKQITRSNTLSVNPVWAPDGKSIIYSHYEGHATNLVQYNLELGFRRLTRDGNVVGIGSLSPDGKKLATILASKNQVDLYVRPIEAFKLTQLTNGKPLESSPCWSPDGKKLCFVSDARNGRPVLCVMDSVAGGKATEISGLVGSERLSPSWSSDNKLAYCAKIGREYELRVAKLSADGKSGVMEEIGGKSAFPGEDPSWAPDNRHVTLTMSDGIYVIDTWLGNKRKLVSGLGKIGQSNWSPVLK
jgi:TolB protein